MCVLTSTSESEVFPLNLERFSQGTFLSCGAIGDLRSRPLGPQNRNEEAEVGKHDIV